MDIGILGPLTVTTEGREIPLGAPKQCALLALLVLRRNEVVPTGMLVDEIWHDHPPATAPKIVQGYVSQLRKTLGPQVLETRLGGYRFSGCTGRSRRESFRGTPGTRARRTRRRATGIRFGSAA